MELVSLNCANFLMEGYVVCDGYNDTVTFGGITMPSFTFGSCFGELELDFPERLDVFATNLTVVLEYWELDSLTQLVLPTRGSWKHTNAA
jgi:hypothetical protein